MSQACVNINKFIIATRIQALQCSQPCACTAPFLTAPASSDGVADAVLVVLFSPQCSEPDLALDVQAKSTGCSRGDKGPRSPTVLCSSEASAARTSVAVRERLKFASLFATCTWGYTIINGSSHTVQDDGQM